MIHGLSEWGLYELTIRRFFKLGPDCPSRVAVRITRATLLVLVSVSVAWFVSFGGAKDLRAEEIRAEEIGAEESGAEDGEDFERTIRPLLAEHCYACHSEEAKTVHGGLRLDTVSAIRSGGDSGAAIDTESFADSLLLEVIRYDGDIQMPPKGKLPANVIGRISAWIERGAPMPRPSETTPREDAAIDFDEGRRFWAFQPAQPHPAPRVRDTTWPRSRIDLFVLAAMKREDLSPSRAANRAVLIRRLSFTLTGLPPTPSQVREFVADPSPGAYADLVDQFLASPHYGEKWGRFWLDMARYTDRTATWLYATGQAHLYRDWVVRAFNDDMPFNDFVHRQLATDLMADTGPEDLPALGFLSLSPTYWKELKLPCEIINTIVADEWEERVDAVSRTFLGLTVACARCHDHKFDPISSEDYYALAGVFASSRQVERPTISQAAYEPVRLAKKTIAELEGEIEKLRQQKPSPQDQIDELKARIDSIKSTTPRYHTPMANVVTDESLYVVRAGKTPQDGTRLEYRPEPRDLPLFIRGNANRPGPIVPRRFLTVLPMSGAHDGKPRRFENGSGRLDLACAITSDAASLTARVIVNRIWLAHFGRGLVDTPSNFGRQGSRPTHPKLLDDLAARFIANGWSIKQLHREILLSATWRQSSNCDQQQMTTDPDNRWLARMPRRRLEFEAWRDSIVAATGDLDTAIGGHSVELDQAGNRRRTIYATVHRRDMSTTLSIHDFPDPTQHSPSRSATTTPLQGLYALNGPLLSGQSVALAERVCHELENDQERIQRVYWLLYSRAPSEKEAQLGIEFLGDSSGRKSQDSLATIYACVARLE